jgi:ATP-dependent RNA helicase DeaD
MRFINLLRVQKRSRVLCMSTGSFVAGPTSDAAGAFALLGLAPALAAACAQQGYARPTAVQQRAVAAVLASCDVWVAAPTGSGKTVAFAAPVLQRCLEPDAVAQRAAAGRGSGPTALVLVPTRELALQASSVTALS